MRIIYKLRYLAMFILCFIFFSPYINCYAKDFDYALDTDGQLVIVIDPGHGGDNPGADYDQYLEKEMNMIVANAMMDELSKYDGITVYLTHNSSEDNMTIKKRAEFAKSVNADFLFCLHFNMSPENILFGSEVWIPAYGDYNREAYRFATIQMNNMKDMGLYLRGVKTKLNEDKKDYYGILRFCSELDIPSALIEHCHVDHEEDTPFCDSTEDLIALGIADATSVAEYFSLKSSSEQIDYSQYEYRPFVNPGTLYAIQDITEPDVCMIEVMSFNKETNIITIQVTASDYDSPMLYYSYSIDGSKNYSPYIAWPETDVIALKSQDCFTFDIKIPENTTPSICIKAVNLYDIYTISNTITDLNLLNTESSDIENSVSNNSMEGSISSNDEKNKSHDVIVQIPADAYKPPIQIEDEEDHTFINFLKISTLAVVTICIALLFINLMLKHHKKI